MISRRPCSLVEGPFNWNTARASVTDSCPDGAKIEGETTVRVDLPVAGDVEVEARTLIGKGRMLITGRDDGTDCWNDVIV